MKKILTVFILLLSLCGCSTKNGNHTNTLGEIIEENNYVVLDVRTKEEYAKGHVKDALNIPYDEIDEKIGIAKDKTILVYCQSGKRSKKAYDTLTSLGYNVYDMGAYATVDMDKE